MTSKRPTIKGKGADFFFEEPKSKFATQIKATFYLPKSLIEKLDDVWLELRKANRKLKKSDIARTAFEELFQDYDKQHQNSKLAEHLNVKISKQQ